MRLTFVASYVLLVSLLCREIYGHTTVNQQEKTALQVVWMLPSKSHTNTNFVHNASSSVAALALGLDKIEREQILSGHVLK